MIVKEADVKQGATWDGTSALEGGAVGENLDSQMPFPEHQRIVVEAKSLLASFDAKAISIAWMNRANGNVGAGAFGKLKTCYDGSDTNMTLTVTKGIHQPYSNPHLTLSLKQGASAPLVFHLNVSAVRLSGGEARGVSQNRFNWKGVQFTFVGRGSSFKWPENATVVGKSRRGRLRRQSISHAGISDANDTFDADQAVARAKAEKERAEKAEQLRLDQETAEREAAAKQAKKAHDAHVNQAQAQGQKMGEAWTRCRTDFLKKHSPRDMPHVGIKSRRAAYGIGNPTQNLKDGWKLSCDGTNFKISK